MTFLGETEHFSGKNGALRWSILVGKQKHNVQKPMIGACLQVFTVLFVSRGPAIIYRLPRRWGRWGGGRILAVIT